MPDFFLTGWKLSDFTGLLSTNTTNTTGTPFVGTSATLSASAEEITFGVDDDDARLEDAYIETGSTSFLAEDLVLDGETFAGGTTGIEAEFTLVTDDTPPITFVIGRLGTGASNSGENYLVFTDTPLTPGATYTFADSSDGPRIPYNIICFAAGTLIETPTGPVPVERLSVGDLVLTRDAGAKPIQWLGQRRLTKGDLTVRPSLRPVRIAAGALGDGRPSTDLVVSPQHRLLIDDWRAEHLFGEPAVLAPAIGLMNDTSIRSILPPEGVTYVHFLVDHHALVSANGTWAETLLMGGEARRTLGQAAMAEIEAVFPDSLPTLSRPVRPILTVREARVVASPR
ncbi:MAG: Hint domain-containing protein [Pseudomonadota bacterium]